MAILGVMSFGIAGAVIVGISEIPTLKARVHDAIAMRPGRITDRAPAGSSSQSEPANGASAYTASDLEAAVAFAVEVERERHEPYPREWE